VFCSEKWDQRAMGDSSLYSTEPYETLEAAQAAIESACYGLDRTPDDD
jgi:hypothetical protein